MSLYDDILKNYIAKPTPLPAQSPITAPVTNINTTATVSSTPVSERAGSIPTMDQYNPLSRGGGALETMYKTLHKDLEPESPEQAAEREKRERRNSNIVALSDALSGIANIWGATKGAAPMDLSSMSEANRMRYEYAKREREGNKDAWRRGVFNARIQDVNARNAAERARQEALEKEKERQYKIGRDKSADAFKEKEFTLKKSEADRKAELDRLKFEEEQKKNAADLKIRQRTVALAEKKAAESLDNTSGSGPKKVVRFGLKDGTNITVPDDLKGSYVADVYNQLVQAAGDTKVNANGETKNPILSFMKFHYGQKEPGLSEMMTAIELYKDKYPGIETYMIERANQYTENYQTPAAKDQAAPGSPGESKVPLNLKGLAPNWGQRPLIDQLSNEPLTEDDLSQYLVE